MIELSVVIPNRNSIFTTKTINDVLKNAGCEVEVIVNVDEKWPTPLVEDARVHYIHPPMPIGMRQGINNCVKLAKGKYIMKTDDHCAFGENFGRILIDNHKENNWVQIPRRYALDAENWKREERTDDKYPLDYMYTDFPRKGKENDDGTHGVEWRERRNERRDPQFDIDETPSIQGSCYFMTKDYFENVLGGLHEEIYGQFSQESQEICFKTWLGGGKVMVNKKTWYAHLHKGKIYGRMYKMPDKVADYDALSASHWLNNEEPNMIHTFAWFINEKFPNMPGWPSDWELQIKQMGWIK